MAFGPVRRLFVVLDPTPAISSTLLSVAVGFKDWILFIIGPLLGTVTVFFSKGLIFRFVVAYPFFRCRGVRSLVFVLSNLVLSLPFVRLFAGIAFVSGADIPQIGD